MARDRILEEDPATAAGDHYLALVRRFPLRPIRSDAQLDRAVAVIDSLIDQDELTPDEDDYLDVLSDLVEKYENEAHPCPPSPTRTCSVT